MRTPRQTLLAALYPELRDTKTSMTNGDESRFRVVIIKTADTDRRTGMSQEIEEDFENRVDETRTWPELAIGLYDMLTGRGAQITYDFEDMEVDVPSKVGGDADHARWRVDGTIHVTTEEE